MDVVNSCFVPHDTLLGGSPVGQVDKINRRIFIAKYSVSFALCSVVYAQYTPVAYPHLPCLYRDYALK